MKDRKVNCIKLCALIATAILFFVASLEYALEYMDWESPAIVYVWLVVMVICMGVAAWIFAMPKYWKTCKKVVFAVVSGVSIAVVSLIETIVVNTLIGKGLLNTLAINISSAITVVMFEVMLAMAFATLKKDRKVKKVGRVVIAVVVVACAFGTCVIVPNIDDVKRAIFMTDDFSFETISNGEIAVSEEEKSLCRSWYNENIVYAGSNGKVPAYDCGLGATSLRNTIDDWSFAVGAESEENAVYRGGKTTEITAYSEKFKLDLRVEATIYEENATCEWTVYMKNSGEENSKKVHDFYALDSLFDIGTTDLYCSQGSHSEAEDFTLRKVKNLCITQTFGGSNGRPTVNYLPYFNLYGENYGVDLAIGWMGNWQTKIWQIGENVRIKAKQSTLNAELLPGEEVRSPMVSLTFYKTKNPLKGFNSFRNWVKDCLYSENLPTYDNVCDLINCSPTLTEEEIMENIDAIPEEIFNDVYAFWIDAGWYCAGEGTIWDDRFGYWDTVDERLQGGVKAYSDYGENYDVGLVLWYEPERQLADSNSDLMQEALKHDDWLLYKDGSSDYVVWNYSNAEAAAYISAYISESLKENGVSVFRQDSNFEPEEYWEYADKNYYNCRNGICENHYVTNHYAFLDYLFADNADLKLYDICASGGTRLELEMIHRGVPLWRSDYNCFPEMSDLIEATQSQSYSIAFWLSYSGTASYTWSEYALRSSMYQHIIIDVTAVKDTELMKNVAQYEDIRTALNKNYYPIAFAEHDDYANILAMQYGDEESGYALIYKRKDVEEKEIQVSLGLLDEVAEYCFYDFDKPEDSHILSGNALMTDGINVTLPDGEKVIILCYQKVQAEK